MSAAPPEVSGGPRPPPPEGFRVTPTAETPPATGSPANGGPQRGPIICPLRRRRPGTFAPAMMAGAALLFGRRPGPRAGRPRRDSLRPYYSGPSRGAYGFAWDYPARDEAQFLRASMRLGANAGIDYPKGRDDMGIKQMLQCGPTCVRRDLPLPRAPRQGTRGPVDRTPLPGRCRPSAYCLIHERASTVVVTHLMPVSASKAV